MQTSRECVKRAIQFKNPDRIPMCMDIDRDPINKPIADKVEPYSQKDIIIVSCSDPLFKRDVPNRSEWGYLWESMGETMGEVKQNPIATWEQYDEWLKIAPDFAIERRYDMATKMRKKFPDKFLAGGVGFVMMELINLRGYAEYMMDFHLERENLEKLIDKVYFCSFDAIDGFAEAGMDAIIVWEDWGLQDRLMINPILWHEIFYERMKKFVEYIHSKGMLYILHCCGYIVDIMDDLIEMGVDVIQMDQQSCMGFSALSKWKGKICFFNPVDIQLSSQMNQEEIQQYAKDMVFALKAGKTGGFMYKTYSQPAAIHVTAEQILWEADAFRKIKE